MIVGDNFFDGLQVVFGSMLVWSEVHRPRNDNLFITIKTAATLTVTQSLITKQRKNNGKPEVTYIMSHSV